MHGGAPSQDPATGEVDRVGLRLKETFRRGGGGRVGIGHAVGQQFGDTPGVEHDVVVDDEDVGGFGRQRVAYADVVAACVAEITARLQQGDVWMGLPNRGLGAILRAVIDDDEIERDRLLL